MAEFTEIASGLRFPEGPIAMPDGSVILTEMFGKKITRVKPDGTKETIVEVLGGPNGIAFGVQVFQFAGFHVVSLNTSTDVVGFNHWSWKRQSKKIHFAE